MDGRQRKKNLYGITFDLGHLYISFLPSNNLFIYFLEYYFFYRFNSFNIISYSLSIEAGIYKVLYSSSTTPPMVRNDSISILNWGKKKGKQIKLKGSLYTPVTKFN